MSKNILLILFIISWFITIVFCCIGIYNVIGTSLLSNIIVLILWILNGYIYIRAYTAVIDDHSNEHNKKQP